ncbi:uncharacterized protein RJT20DRAFT_54066 [Scheffersomyces xylosifermentans]|uniref:uncharacterized protein n=1 Tax=Scheffersomyces xylosifermentans TaxID=1304137 RepID=UPI00315C93B4
MTIAISNFEKGARAIALKTNILIVGGSFAGLAALNQFHKKFSKEPQERKISVTLVEPRAGLFNALGAPRCIVNPEFAQTQYIPFTKFTKYSFNKVLTADPRLKEELLKSNSQGSPLELNFIHGKINSLNATEAQYQLNGSDNKSNISFDYVILASGRDRQWPVTPKAHDKAIFLDEMKDSRKKIADSQIVSVIGAGAVGVELAADIKVEFPDKTVNLIHPHPTFPPEPLAESFKESVKKSFEDAGVKLHLNVRIAEEMEGGDLVATNGDVISSDFNLWCTASRNNLDYLSDELQTKFLSPKKNLSVNKYLQLSRDDNELPNFYVAGDLVEIDVIKSAGWALHMGIQAADNISNMILNKEPETTLPDVSLWPKKMAIVAGKGDIISCRGPDVVINEPRLVQEFVTYRFGSCFEIVGYE